MRYQSGHISRGERGSDFKVDDDLVSIVNAAVLPRKREEQRLQATVRKPANARAYEHITVAKAERDTQIATAEAEAQRVKLEAQVKPSECAQSPAPRSSMSGSTQKRARSQSS